MIRIGVDAMGGDNIPENVILGTAAYCASCISDTEVTLIGDKEKITEACQQNGLNPGNFCIEHASETIGMGEHPVESYMKKTDSSIVKGFRMLSDGRIDVFAGAGNTGAMSVGAVYGIRPLTGISKPCIPIVIPCLDGTFTVMLDVGMNPECKPDSLYQYAVLGSIYAKEYLKVQNPSVALLNIGAEEEKGSMALRETYKLLSYTKGINFKGNIEPREMFLSSKADVIVTDGFVGNIVLKVVEGVYDTLTAAGMKNEALEKFNYEMYGGTPVLGAGAPVVIGHGASSPLAISNMIKKAADTVRIGLIDKIKRSFENYGN